MGTHLIPLSGLHQTFHDSLTSFRIGGVSLTLKDETLRVCSLDRSLRSFACATPRPDIEVLVEWVDHLSVLPAEPAFDSNAVWKLFHRGQELVFDFFSPNLGGGPYKRLCAEDAFHSARLSLNCSLLEKCVAVSPLEYPTDELLFTNYLAARGLGVEVHGCGLIDPETGGRLFLGHSGAGKSTIAHLWDTLRGAEILSDDRLILRLHDGELWMYGTPWHGEAAFATPSKTRVNNIFVLHHGTANNFVPLHKPRGVGEIFARSFPPFHSPSALERTVDFLKQVVDTVPCYEFQFVPDQSAIASVLAFHA